VLKLFGVNSHVSYCALIGMSHRVPPNYTGLGTISISTVVARNLR